MISFKSFIAENKDKAARELKAHNEAQIAHAKELAKAAAENKMSEYDFNIHLHKEMNNKFGNVSINDKHRNIAKSTAKVHFDKLSNPEEFKRRKEHPAFHAKYSLIRK